MRPRKYKPMTSTSTRSLPNTTGTHGSTTTPNVPTPMLNVDTFLSTSRLTKDTTDINYTINSDTKETDEKELFKNQVNTKTSFTKVSNERLYLYSAFSVESEQYRKINTTHSASSMDRGKDVHIFVFLS